MQRYWFRSTLVLSVQEEDVTVSASVLVEGRGAAGLSYSQRETAGRRCCCWAAPEDPDTTEDRQDSSDPAAAAGGNQQTCTVR